MNERRKKITVSKVGIIAKMRATTKCSAKVEQLLYTKFRGNAATRYGQNNEDETRKAYVHYMREKGHTELHVDRCGLFISPENPWLASSPDGLVTDPADETSQLGLVEIKKIPILRENRQLVKLLPVLHSVSSRTKMGPIHSSQGTIITFRYSANSTALEGTGVTLWSKQEKTYI